MRFAPVATSKQDYDNLWYVAQGFGAVTTYGKHEGIDLNLKTGGDTDLGQPLYAIADGQIIYYHYGSHPTTGFGRHLVYKIEGAWGTRWCMYAHCGDNAFLNALQNVTEGQKVAELGKSGNSPSAHLHFSIWKVDPASNGGIDAIAHNDTELKEKWEDPIAFLNQWTQIVTPPQLIITDQTKIPQIVDENGNSMEVQAIRSKLNDQTNTINNLNSKLNQIKTIVG